MTKNILARGLAFIVITILFALVITEFNQYDLAHIQNMSAAEKISYLTEMMDAGFSINVAIAAILCGFILALYELITFFTLKVGSKLHTGSRET